VVDNSCTHTTTGSWLERASELIWLAKHFLTEFSIALC
jgi:hypothetical protein